MRQRSGQSEPSDPRMHDEKVEPSPPSSQMPSSACLHVFEKQGPGAAATAMVVLVASSSSISMLR